MKKIIAFEVFVSYKEESETDYCGGSGAGGGAGLQEVREFHSANAGGGGGGQRWRQAAADANAGLLNDGILGGLIKQSGQSRNRPKRKFVGYTSSPENSVSTIDFLVCNKDINASTVIFTPMRIIKDIEFVPLFEKSE